MTESQDTEISLGAGKLLALFFGLVVLCGAFFGVGYMIGKNRATPFAFAPDNSAAIGSPATVKPSSAIGNGAPAAKNQNCSTPGNCDQRSDASDMTFYKTVEEKNLNSQLTPASATQTSPANTTAPASQIAKPATEAVAAPGSGYVVQIAAVSKQQDADALVAALRKKQYPVFITSNPPGDKLFHVQAGPFSDINEAETVKARLTNDGYSPILKR
jgi:DedD protein